MIEEKKEVKTIQVFGHGRLYNPENKTYFVKFDGGGEALVSKSDADLIKKYHPQVLFMGQKPKQEKKPASTRNVVAKSFRDVKPTFKIPTK